MLVNFTFQNFRSFRDAKSLRMEATTIKELKESVIPKGGYDLLPVAVMYGANSSGKSNVLQALATMRRIVLDSVRLNPDDKLFFKPFLLDLDSPKTPTSFEIQILIDDVKYRYGFDYNQERICKEWLYEITGLILKNPHLYPRAPAQGKLSPFFPAIFWPTSGHVLLLLSLHYYV